MRRASRRLQVNTVSPHRCLVFGVNGLTSPRLTCFMSSASNSSSSADMTLPGFFLLVLVALFGFSIRPLTVACFLGVALAGLLGVSASVPLLSALVDTMAACRQANTVLDLGLLQINRLQVGFDLWSWQGRVVKEECLLGRRRRRLEMPGQRREESQSGLADDNNGRRGKGCLDLLTSSVAGWTLSTK